MKRNRPFFPVQLSTRPTDLGEGFINEVVGGLSVRDVFALEIFCALLSNAALVTNSNSDMLRAKAIEQAGAFIADLGEE